MIGSLGLSLAIVVACGGTTTGGVADGGAPPDLARCSAPGTCIVIPRSCCGSCGAPTTSDMTAVQLDKQSAYRTLACQADQGCPECAMQPNPNLNAACRGGECAAFDLRVDEFSTCQSDADCRLRAGNGCCEPCSGGDVRELVAVATARLADFKAELCRPSDGACPRCLVQYPSGYAARCDPATKHCVVTTAPVDAGAD